jgi:hypothetical protein
VLLPPPTPLLGATRVALLGEEGASVAAPVSVGLRGEIEGEIEKRKAADAIAPVPGGDKVGGDNVGGGNAGGGSAGGFKATSSGGVAASFGGGGPSSIASESSPEAPAHRPERWHHT